MCSQQNIFGAWRKFARGKKERSDIQIFVRNLEENLFNLQEELLTHHYSHHQYTPFTIYDPKERRIHKAEVRDRVVHQALTQVLEPIFERQFIHDSFSCRIGKGTHAASKRLQYFLRRASSNSTRTVYALKCDIRKFFDSVDHAILLRLITRSVKDADIYGLLLNIISSFAKLPGKGLPIGNLTSQLFANVYLHEFDRFIKHELKEKFYLRYCDDFIVLSPSRKYLLFALALIQTFLKRELWLDLHPNKVSIRSWRQGIDFVGYVHMPHCIVLRTKTKLRLLQRVNTHNVTSYLGLCKHANTFEMQQIILTKIS